MTPDQVTAICQAYKVSPEAVEMIAKAAACGPVPPVATVQGELAKFEAWAMTSDGNCSDLDMRKYSMGAHQRIDGLEFINALVQRDWEVWQARAAQSAPGAGAVPDGFALVPTKEIEFLNKTILELQAPIAAQEPVYQVESFEVRSGFITWLSLWKDADKYTYDKTAENRRRIVYTAPPAPQAVPSELPPTKTRIQRGDQVSAALAASRQAPQHAGHPLEIYAETYDLMSRVAKGEETRNLAHCVAVDIRHNMIPVTTGLAAPVPAPDAQYKSLYEAALATIEIMKALNKLEASPDARDAVLVEALMECEGIRKMGCEVRAGAAECCAAISQLRAMKSPAITQPSDDDPLETALTAYGTSHDEKATQPSAAPADGATFCGGPGSAVKKHLDDANAAGIAQLNSDWGDAAPFNVVTNHAVPPGQAVFVQNGKEVGRIVNIGADPTGHYPEGIL